MSYLIDTCAIIDLLTGKLSKMARDWLATNAEAGLTKTSAVVYHELLFGANTPKTQKAIENLLQDWIIIPVDQAVAAQAATIRPPSSTICAAADRPLTDWYRFRSRG